MGEKCDKKFQNFMPSNSCYQSTVCLNQKLSLEHCWQFYIEVVETHQISHFCLSKFPSHIKCWYFSQKKTLNLNTLYVSNHKKGGNRRISSSISTNYIQKIIGLELVFQIMGFQRQKSCTIWRNLEITWSHIYPKYCIGLTHEWVIWGTIFRWGLFLTLQSFQINFSMKKNYCLKKKHGLYFHNFFLFLALQKNNPQYQHQ